MSIDWQEPDPTAYDPDSPLALLEKAAGKEGMERTQEAIWALQSMLMAGVDQSVIEGAREYVATSKVLLLGSFDRIVRRHEIAAHREQREGDPNAKSASTVLVDLAQERFTFGVTDTGESFAIPNDGPKVVAMLRGGKTSLRALLAREYFAITHRAPAQQALADALLVLEGMAQDGPESALYMRAARRQGALWLDLGDHTGRAVRITASGWTIEDSAPVLFKRTALTGPLPEPRPGGRISDLWKWLNVAEDDRPLVAAALVAMLFSDQPHVILAIFGEQGTGKTTALKVLVRLLDPSPVPVRKPPRDADSWVTAAAGSWVVGLDNLSDIPPWLSDSLCRASTGDGDVRRKLYSDSDYAVFSFRRCVIFDAIDVGALAADLADRAVPITLELIGDDDRLDEETFWSEWQHVHPELLGAVLDLGARVMARLPAVKLTRTPRMADFGRILAAVDAELGTEAFDRYTRQASKLAAEGLSGDSFAVRIMEAIDTTFEGTSKRLAELAAPRDPEWKQPKDWPASTRAVTGLMRRLAPAFRKTGWQVAELEPGHANAIRWRISPPPPAETCREDTRQPSQDSQLDGDASDASECEHSDGPSPYVGQEKCAGCGAPMTVLEPGQLYHPTCEPEEAKQ